METMARKLLLISLFALTATYAGAGVTTAKVNNILIYDAGNLIYVYPVGGVQNPPACHGSNGNYYSFSMSRPLAREYLSALLAAQMSGAVVTFWGKGACIDQSVSETLSYLLVRRPT